MKQLEFSMNRSQTNAPSRMIDYEQPLNERIRTFLRLDFLFNKALNRLESTDIWDSRSALTSIIDIITIFSRSDLKAEVLKELERHTSNLSKLEHKSGIDASVLNGILNELDLLSDRLHAINGQVGQQLRTNEFISSIVQRSVIPGGTCDFDLPAYHHWLQQSSDVRIQDLQKWFDAFSPVRLAIGLILQLIRESAVPTVETAVSGFYNATLNANLPFQMIRVTVPDSCPCFAEISGGKHRFTIRFLEPGINGQRPLQTSRDIEFELSCCLI